MNPSKGLNVVHSEEKLDGDRYHYESNATLKTRP